MKVAHYPPNDFHKIFCGYMSDIEFLDNECTADCSIIYCASASKLKEAFQAKLKYPKIPLICWVWDIPYNWREWKGPLYDGDDLEINRDGYINQIISLLRMCDKVLCGSEWTKGVLKQYHIDAECIDWYIDTPTLDRYLLMHTRRGKYQSKRIIQVNRFVPHKRFELVLEANKGEFIVDCAGQSDEESPYWRTLFFKYASNHNVIFHPNISDDLKVQLLLNANIFVSASVFEGWGMTPAEATYCGLPIILPDIPVFKDFYGKGPIYFEKDNVEDLRDKILGALQADTSFSDPNVHKCQQRIKDCTPAKFSVRWKNAVGI